MTVVNKAELRRLCEDAKDLDWEFDWMDKRAHAVRQMATPANVLSLLDECERAERVVNRECQAAESYRMQAVDLQRERDAALAELEQLRRNASAVTFMELTSEIVALRSELEACKKDAERYRLLREAHWWESPLCVVRDPKRQVKPGTDCPSGERLDEAVDALKAQEACNG